MKLAAVGLVGLLVVAGFAGYWAVSAAPSSSGSSPAPLYSYTQSAGYGYVARLANNSLYNSTNLTSGNGTLFTSITEWVNLTFRYGLTVSVAAGVEEAIHGTVSIVTPAWSKSIGTFSGGPVSAAATEVEGVTAGFDLNVSNVTSEVAAIEHQTNYFPDSFLVVLSPTVRTTIDYQSHGLDLGYAPALSLNFSTGQIVPGRLASEASGQYLPPGGAPSTGGSGAGPWPYVLLAGSLAGAAALGALLVRRPRTERLPDLSALTRPFQEAIVDTPTPPPLLRQVALRGWEDLVKVADTLGCPIMRVAPEGASAASGGSPETVFYVVAGSMSYVYTHTGAEEPGSTAAPPVPTPPTPAGGPPPGPRPLAFAPSSPKVSPGPGLAARWDLGAFIARADQVRLTLQGMPSDRFAVLPPEERPEELLRRAVGLARTGQLPTAWVVLERLRAELNDPRAASRTISGGVSRSPGTIGRVR
jgi:hypothetical protein